MQEPAEATIDQLILDRLSEAGLGDRPTDLIFAALAGRDEFGRVLGGGTIAPPSASRDTETGEPVGTYIDRVEVTGFRGIGPKAELSLHPGPGLTIVTGRNGSGKSSFAEAAEMAFTAANQRWVDRTEIWKGGWRNLHATDDPRIRVHLGMEGHRQGATIECTWDGAGNVDDAKLTFQIHGKPRLDLADLGWGRALDVYRPFLSYAELGGLLSGRPSEMFDAMQRILGLDRIVDIEKMLKEARRQQDVARKAATGPLATLRAALTAHPDPRARTAEAILEAKTPDLDALRELTGAADAGHDGDVVALRQIDAAVLPAVGEIADIVTSLWAAQDTAAALAGTSVDRDRSVALLLAQALDHVSTHPGESCPVCGGRVLDDVWAAQAREQVEGLGRRTRELDAAHEATRAARRALRERVPPAPAGLDRDLGFTTEPARTAWQAWTEAIDGSVSGVLAAYEKLVTEFGVVQTAARAALAERAQAWQPVAEALQTWIGIARASRAAGEAYTALQAAIKFWEGISDEIRNAKLAPVVKEATQVWNTLRQQSNVSLEAIRLAGTGPSRRVDLAVNIDGVPGAALGVMSQGELHSLALSLFLPRATMPESPFRFLVIDDPVQSMDPSKVHGLATVLASVAEHRQVIVFTHDDRLPAAIRQLQIKARIVTVQRRARSTVFLWEDSSGSPAQRYLLNASAIAKDDNITDDVRRAVIANLIRDAVEAASQDVVRRRDFRVGKPVAETEQTLDAATTVRKIVALAIGDASGSANNETLRKFHSAAPRVVTIANNGSHGDPVSGSLLDIVKDARVFIAALEAL